MGSWQDLESKFWDTVDDYTGNQGQDNLAQVQEEWEALIETVHPSTPNIQDEEETGDELRAKQGTDFGIPVIYGTRRIGGILIYQEVEADDGDNELLNLYQCWALCEGEVQSWQVFVDDTELSQSDYWRDNPFNYGTANGVTNKGYSSTDRLIQVNNTSHFNWGTSLGDDGGIDYPAVTTNGVRASGANWRGSDSGATHKMKGIACEQISYRHHWKEAYTGSSLSRYAFGQAPVNADNAHNQEGKDIWRTGLPKMAFDVVGPVIKDNNGTTKSSKDPAWILYDYLTDPRYGCSIPVDEIDVASFASASDICCEETTDGVAHADTPRHECNIILDTVQPVITNVKRILATCNGRLHWINGLYTIKIDDKYTGTGEFNFLEKHIIGGLNITGDSVGKRLNQVTAKFINPDKNWKSDEVRYPDINKISPINEKAVYDDFLDKDNDVKHTKTINVGGVTNLNQARYLAKQACLRSRDNLSVSFRCTSEAMNVVIGDVVTITHSTPSWSAKEFIVRSISLNADGSCSLSCLEHNDAIYAWETVAIPAEAPNTNLPDIKSVTAPTDLTMTPSSYQSIASSGTRLSVQLEWLSAGAFTVGHDVEYKLNSISGWTSAGSTNGRSMLLQDFSTGTFDFRVRAINSVGSTSSWTTLTLQEVSGAILATPEDVGDFEVNIASSTANTVLATWAPPTDADLKTGGHIEIRNLMQGATQWEEAETLATVSGTTTSVLLPLLEGNYVAKWIGSEGLEAVNFKESGLGTVFWTNTIDTITYHDTYAGDLTNLYIADNDGTKLLKFISTGRMDDFPALDSMITKFDEQGGSETEGTYIADIHDMGQAHQMRLYTKKVFTSGVSDGSNYVDTWGKVDSRNSWDDIPRLAGVTSYIRTTLDDPANPASEWSTWKKFQVADVNARGIQLKVQFSSDQEGAEQFRMSGLQLLIDMSAKVIGENDKSATSITYLENFYERPNLVVTPKNMVSGDYMTLSSESKTGFSVNFFNASDGAVTRNYNYLAKGIG